MLPNFLLPPLLLFTIPTALAQRPSNTSVCDYYTTLLLKTNNASTQYALVTLIVNTAVIGNYTKPNVGVAVPGILTPGDYNGTAVDLLPFFDGGLASSNRGGTAGVAVNFLDDGGAVPLMRGLPSEGTGSNQFLLLTHLYQIVGVLLGCSFAGSGTAFPVYSGHSSLYEVHKFMDLNAAQVGYFITQIGLSAASFGVSTEDVDGAGLALAKLFGYRCSPPTTVVPAQGPQLQSVCLADDCPVDLNATCDSYELALEPTVANATLAMGEGGNGTNGTGAANSTMITSATLTATESGLTGGSPTGTSSSSGSKTSGTKSAGVAIKAAGSLVSLLLGVLASLV